MKKTQALLVGFGYAGKQFANVIMHEAEVSEKIDLAAVIDKRLDALLEYKKTYPDSQTKLFLLKTEASDEDQKRFLLSNDNVEGIVLVDSIANAIEQEHIDALINATNNPSHVPVLQDALSALQEGSIIIHEDPYDNPDRDDINQVMRDKNIIFSLNSILRYSPVWDAFHENLAKINERYGDLEIDRVEVDYGKDRTQDNRECTHWFIQDSTHPLSLSYGIGLTNIQFDEVAGIEGYLSQNAGIHGEVIHTTKAIGTAEFQDKTIPYSLSGTFDYNNHGKYKEEKNRNREIAVFFANKASDVEVEFRLNFDVAGVEEGLVDQLTIIKTISGEVVSKDSITPPKENKMATLLLDTIKGQPRHDLETTLKVHETMDALCPMEDNITVQHAQLRP